MTTIMNSDDAYDLVRRAKANADVLRKRFDLIAEHLETLETNQYAFGSLGITINRGADFFDLISPAQKLRFYLLLRFDEQNPHALVKVFKLPTHEVLEVAVEVGSFTMDTQGDSSLLWDGQAIRLYGERTCVPVALDFLAKALTCQLPPAVAQ